MPPAPIAESTSYGPSRAPDERLTAAIIATPWSLGPGAWGLGPGARGLGPGAYFFKNKHPSGGTNSSSEYGNPSEGSAFAARPPALPVLDPP